MDFDLGIKFPGREGVLKKTLKIPYSDLEVVRAFNGESIDFFVLDNDGTLQHARDPWHYWMTETFMKFYLQAGLPDDKKSLGRAADAARQLFIATAGMDDYFQCQLWSDYLVELGGKRINPEQIQEDYSRLRATRTQERINRLGTDKLEVFGVDVLLNILTFNRPGKVDIASGTEDKQNREIIKAFKFDKYIPESHIFGAQPGTHGAKATLVAELSRGGKVVAVIGDTRMDMYLAYVHKGIGIGLITKDMMDGYKPLLTPREKRWRLIEGGAHIIVNCEKSAPPCFTSIDNIIFSSRYENLK